MADRGITFSAPMVHALLEGRKTQTRRLLNPQPKVFPINVDGTPCEVGCLHVEGEPRPRIFTGRALTAQTLPHAVGDRLYVREHWKTHIAYEDLAPSEMGGEETILYLADMSLSEPHPDMPERCVGRHRQAMHMPRWASRLTLLVTDVRVQQLQDISETDAIAEGPYRGKASGRIATNHTAMVMGDWYVTARAWYCDLWDSLHTSPGTRWEDNPWVYALTFDVRRGNIDQIANREGDA